MSPVEGFEAKLDPLRAQIDAIDDQLVSLLGQRIKVVDEVVTIKAAHKLPARLEGRIEEVVARVRARAERVDAPADLAEVLWRTMIEWIIAYEDLRLEAGTRQPSQQDRAPRP